MRFLVFILVLALIPICGFSQITNLEMTTSWEETSETLIPEEGNLPPDTDISSSTFFSRFRIQNKLGMPVLELRHSYLQKHFAVDNVNLRVAFFLPTPVKMLKLKGMYSENNPETGGAVDEYGIYAIGINRQYTLMAGVDYKESETEADRIWSVRAKYNMSFMKLMAGFSTQPDSNESANRFGTGIIMDLPMQMVVGGLVGFWEEDMGYSINIGRHNRPGQFGGLPSFALNYLEVPNTYKWMNFRIMFGDKGRHYVRPTFDNPIHSGMLDLDMALMLKQLVGDNYRHFDTPLLFLRYDEYGTAALRINYIDIESNFRRFDANISYNSGKSLAIIKNLRGVFTFDRMHNPAFGWQDNRYHFNVGGYLFNRAYLGTTWSSDFNEYSKLLLELRLQAKI